MAASGSLSRAGAKKRNAAQRAKKQRGAPLKPGRKYDKTGKVVKDRRRARVRKRRAAYKRGKGPYRGFNPNQKRDKTGKWSK